MNMHFRNRKVQIVFTGILLLFLVNSLFLSVPTTYAQSLQGWTTPVNLSNSGSSKNPSLIVDSNGVIHVFWVDEFDGYKYSESNDGVQWTSPKTIQFPALIKENTQPVFVSDNIGGIHILWRDKSDALFYSTATSDGLGDPSKWTGNKKIADSVVNFGVIVDAAGTVHIGYVANKGDNSNPAGVYYIRQTGSSWSDAKTIYSSQYFRSLDTENTNIRLAVSDDPDLKHVYIVWDDRAQKRIFLAKSSNGGDAWDSSEQIRGPEDASGLDLPYNVNVGYVNGNVLLIWQFGIPGNDCVQYGQLYNDAEKQFGTPVKILEKSAICPQNSNFIFEDNSVSVVSFSIQNDLALLAWNGSIWSELQTQNDISTFTNPRTFDNVILGCQSTSYYEKKLFVAGCDMGNGGDIWFTSRPIGSVDDWFPSPSVWTSPTLLASVDLKVSDLSTVSDNNDNIHAFWVQTKPSLNGEETVTIEYSRRTGEKWSAPTTILSGLSGKPIELTSSSDTQGRLLLAWIDAKTGEMLFSWAGADRANRASEWETPQFVPVTSQSISSPDILVDASGKIIIGYAVPINEQRGIYIIESEDGGKEWSHELKVFDAASSGWDMIGQPKFSLTGDGRLHALFSRFSLFGDQEQSLGLYYSQSADGGASWSDEETVSEQSVTWSDIIGYDKLSLHRLWQEKKQSAIVNYHQMSQDGGMTWSKPTIVSRTSGESSLVKLVVDPIGNLHLLQLVDEDKFFIDDRRWDGIRWNSQESKDLDIKNNGLPISLAASITSKGYLVAVTSMNYPDPGGLSKTEIFSLGYSLQMSGDIATPYPAYVPTVGPDNILIEDTPIALQTPTQISPLAGINDTKPLVSKNLIGFLLVAGILVLIVFVVWPRSKKNG